MARNSWYFEPGIHIDDRYEAKILIAYFLWQMAMPVTRAQLDEIFTLDGSVNYFLYSEAVEQMIESGLIVVENRDGKEVYILTERAKHGANDFKRMVPKSTRDRILSTGMKFFAKLKNDNDVKLSVEKESIGYTVSCRCTEGELVLMELKLFALDEDQVNVLKQKIEKNPAAFYSKVIDYAVDNEDYNPNPKEVNDL